MSIKYKFDNKEYDDIILAEGGFWNWDKTQKKFEMLVPIIFSREDIKHLMEKQLSEHSDYIDINKLIETKINN